MCNQCISFHFAEAYTAATLSSFDRLMCDIIDGPRRSYLPLIGDHVTQSLIVDDSHEDVGCHLTSIDATVNAFSSIVIVAAGIQQLTEVIDRRILLGESEWGRIVD